MALRTRLDGRSEKNSTLLIIGKDGSTLATITACSNKVELAIETADGIFVDKDNKNMGLSNG